MVIAICKYPSMIKLKKVFEPFTEKNFRKTRVYNSNIELCNNPPVADVYCTGSDQVWNDYLEGTFDKEFVSTLHYLSLDRENEEAFSQAYLKLLLELGSEIDVAFKQYCRNIDPSFRGEKITDYQACVRVKEPDFIMQNVEEKITGRTLMPWAKHDNSQNAPYWWKAYNKVKHNRTEGSKIDSEEKLSYKFANQKYTLLALAGLYQILVC